MEAKLSVKERLIRYIKYKRLSQRKFEEAANLSNGYINSLRHAPSATKLQSILDAFPDINHVWLLTGEGEMLNEEETVFVDDVRKDMSIVPLYDVDVSAGLEKLFASGGACVGNISIPNMPTADGAVHVVGDSMYPLLKAGDIIAYRVINEISSILYGEIYILQIEHDGDMQVVVKYIKRSENPDCVLLVSYNKEHDPMDIPRSWITALARVTFSIRKYSML
jgi:phage repressor protein C with HTH and peptisase S24 domain